MSTKVTLPLVFDYPKYIDFVRSLVKEEKTSGPDQSEELVYYTGLNLVRMERIKKTFAFTEELSQAVRSLRWSPSSASGRAARGSARSAAREISRGSSTE